MSAAGVEKERPPTEGASLPSLAEEEVRFMLEMNVT